MSLNGIVPLVVRLYNIFQRDSEFANSAQVAFFDLKC